MAPVLLLFAALFAFYYWKSEPENIKSEFDLIAEAGRPSPAFSKYRLLCFNDVTGLEQRDFSIAAKNAGVNIDKSLNAGGVDGSCHGYRDSDASGKVGIVRGEEVRCVANYRFIYVLEGKRAACIEPSRLKISREVFRSTPAFPGRPWQAKIGEPYYKIEAQQP